MCVTVAAGPVDTRDSPRALEAHSMEEVICLRRSIIRNLNSNVSSVLPVTQFVASVEVLLFTFLLQCLLHQQEAEEKPVVLCFSGGGGVC